MTVTTHENVATYEGDGSTTTFTFSFYVPNASTLSVSLYDTTVTPATLETITPSLYLAEGFGDTAGGTVAYPLSGDPVSSGQFISIARILPATQDVSIAHSHVFYPEAIETGLNTLAYIDQQQATRLVEIAASIDFPLPPVDQDISEAVFDTLTADFGVVDELDVTTGTVGTFKVTGPRFDTSITVGSVTSGQTVTLSSTASFRPLSMTQAAAALTVHLPPAPTHGQIAGFSIDQNVTVLTLSGNGATLKNPPVTTSTQSAGATYAWVYDDQTPAWFRYKSAGARLTTPLSTYFTAAQTLNIPATATARTSAVVMTITGASVGDFVMISPSVADQVTLGYFASYVTAADSVSAIWVNVSNQGGTQNPGSQTLNGFCIPKTVFGL